jgi:hypothetical protein
MPSTFCSSLKAATTVYVVGTFLRVFTLSASSPVFFVKAVTFTVILLEPVDITMNRANKSVVWFLMMMMIDDGG